LSGPVELTPPPLSLGAILRELRPKQWTKNLIVFIGPVFALRLLDPGAMLAALGAFLVFCLLSSAGYIVNDLKDLDSDRLHPDKRWRPLARGTISTRLAVGLAVGLVVVGLSLAFLLGPAFCLVAISYLLLTLLYTYVLKNLVLIDLFAIAAGFVLRAVGGAVVVSVPVSPWLYVCTVLAALFLGLAKRRQELALLQRAAGEHRRNLSEYTIDLVDQLLNVVTSATIMAYSLYTFSAQNLPSNNAMMVTIPIVLYGLFRYIYLVRVRSLGGSPEEVLLGDRPLLTTVAAWSLSCLAVLYLSR
jgi:4-hydroxybenzoate polyprenyltransferase